MSTRTLLFSILVLIASTIVGPVSAGAAPGGRSTDGDSSFADSSWKPEAVECEFLGLINAYRKENGLGNLTISITLGAAAEHHSQDMADNDYFDHTLLGDVTWQQNVASHGYPTDTYRAENIAAGYPSASDTFNQWRKSPGHNANMLNGKFTAIGVGRAFNESAKWDYYWTNTFGSRVDVPYSCGGDTSGGEAPGSTIEIAGGGRTSSSTPSTRAYDGKTSTSWYTQTSSAPRAAYVYFDLGSVKSISKIQWLFAKNGYADSYEIQISTDKKTWKTLTKRTSTKAGTWQTLTKKVSARYVRIYFKNPNKDKTLGYLAEVKFIA